MRRKKNKAIVTGGAGFIGSHLVEFLLEKNCFVLVLDNFSTGRIENLAKVRGHPKLKIVKVDVSNFEKIKNYFKNIDWVFHLAALADIVPSVSEPFKYLKNNILSTLSALEASRINKIGKFLYASSYLIYGIPEIFPTPETAKIDPKFPYALSKAIGEELCLHYWRVYKLPVISLRLVNVYGERARTTGTYGAVFGVFLAQKIHKKPFTVVGDGNQKRDFTYVKDVIEAFWLAANSKFEGEVFNVGAGEPRSINELIKLLGGGKVVYLPKRPGESDLTFADIRKIQKMLNWKPKTSLEEGVKIVLKNIDYWRNAPLWTKEKIKKVTKDWFKYLGKNEEN